MRRQQTHVRAYDSREQTGAYYDQSIGITNFECMSVIIIPYSPISHNKPRMCPPVRKSSDDSVQLMSKATIEYTIGLVKDEEFGVIHPVLDFGQSLDVISKTTRDYSGSSQSFPPLSHDRDRLMRTPTSRLVWSADLSLLMLVPPMTVPTNSQLPAKRLSASTLMWLPSSRVGEMITAHSVAVAPASRRC
jgi:hypothetical protein